MTTHTAAPDNLAAVLGSCHDILETTAHVHGRELEIAYGSWDSFLLSSGGRHVSITALELERNPSARERVDLLVAKLAVIGFSFPE